MSINDILMIYFIIAGAVAGISGLTLLTYGEFSDEIEGFWDWVIYSIFWIKQPLKSLIKFICEGW